MTLYFCSIVEVDLNEKFENINETNIVSQFKKLYSIVSELNVELDKNIVKQILSNTVNLGSLLNFSDEDIIKGCLLKINRNKSRFETGF